MASGWQALCVTLGLPWWRRWCLRTLILAGSLVPGTTCNRAYGEMLDPAANDPLIKTCLKDLRHVQNQARGHFGRTPLPTRSNGRQKASGSVIRVMVSPQTRSVQPLIAPRSL
jgi:hypothetical protein